MHGMESIDENLMADTSAFDWQSPPPQLTIDTNFATPYSADTNIDLGSFSAGSVPSIAITECEQPQTSTVASPVPSFWSGTTRASSPDNPPTSAPHYPPNLAMPAPSKVFSPLGAHTAPSWEFMAQGGSNHLKPQTTDSGDPSRRSSMSSSMGSDDAAVSPYPGRDEDVDMMPIGPVPRLPRQGIFSAQTESPSPGPSRATPGFTDRSRAHGVLPLPSRFEAETLTTEFVQHLDSIEGPKPYSITPAFFGKLCETVYPDPKARSSSSDVSFSIPMARFHVFLSMAIGMKIRIKDSTEKTNALLDRCYELAMQQASAAIFWQESGGFEAAQLLSIFAAIQKEPNFQPKPLQPSFSW
jgi:hypothetical protein